MNANIINIGLYIILIVLFIGCQDDDQILISKTPCGDTDLATISDDKNCDDTDFFLICESVEVSEINFLEDDDFEWIPMLCNEIGESITYKNDLNEIFQIIISHKEHYINKERTNVPCEISIEHASYICQRNETTLIEFTTPIFGNNLTRFKLFRQISDVKDGVVGNSKLYFTLGQPRFDSNVHNFYMYVDVNAQRENRSQVFHENLTLNNIEYDKVYEFLIRETYHSDPHISIYINRANGILGFKKDNKYWLRID